MTGKNPTRNPNPDKTDPSRTRRQADAAKRAVDSPEGEELERAEEIGRKPARD